jgi:hypothetical protein
MWRMHWRYRLRKQELLDERDVGPEVFEGGRERLAEFARPFADGLVRQEQREHARIISPGSSPTSNERPPSRSLIATIRSGTVCNTSSALRPGTIGLSCASWRGRSAAKSAPPTG